MIVAAAGFLLLSRLVKVPSIVAYIIAGLALGPITRLLTVTEAIEIISEVGIVLLLFLVGLELSLDKIKRVGKSAIVIGLLQVVLTTLVGTVASLALGFDPTTAVFLALAMTFSSTVVVVKLLTEKGEFDSLYGRLSIGVLLVQDMVVVAMLTLMAGLDGGGLNVGNVSAGLLRAGGGMTLLMIVALLSARFILPRAFNWISASGEALFIWSLSWCFLFVVAAELLHISVELGAFIAGVSLAQLQFNQELRRRVHPLMNFFIAIFFTTLGVQMELGAAFGQLVPGLILSGFVLLVKPLVFFVVMPRLGFDSRTTFNTGVTLSQVSEFSFIFAALGVSAGFIDDTVLALISVIGLTTIAVSSYAMGFSGVVYEKLGGERLLKLLRASSGRPEAPRRHMHGHVIVIGMNSLGVHLVQELLGRGERVLAIDTDARKLAPLRCETLLGSIDHPSLVEDAELARAKLVVSALQIEDTNNLLAYRCRQLGVPCSIHAFDRSVVKELREIGANHLMIPKNIGVQRMMVALRERGLLDG